MSDFDIFSDTNKWENKSYTADPVPSDFFETTEDYFKKQCDGLLWIQELWKEVLGYNTLSANTNP